jgi:tetratricopeptide (TPR) repeat protein
LKPINSKTTRKTRNPQDLQAVCICIFLALAVQAVFRQTTSFGFVNFDDEVYVYENPVVENGLTWQGTLWAFSVHSSNWHPLTWLSHMLDCQLYGLQAGGHHLTNVLLHTATVILLFLVLRQMTGALWRCAFVAAVFAIHPLRVESVAWVAERKDVLSGLFFMLTLAAYVRYADEFKIQPAFAEATAGKRSKCKVFYGLIILFFVLGLMSKPMLVTLPLVLLLLDYWPLQRVESAGRLVLEKLPLLALSAAACFVTLGAQHEDIKSAGTFALPHRFENALASCSIYLGQMVWPAGLAVLYPFPQNGPPTWEVALAGVLLASLSAGAWGWRRTHPWLLVGWVWYLVMLLPVLGIILVGGQAHADRFTYLPGIGLAMAVTWAVADLSAGWKHRRVALGGLMMAAIGALIICGHIQASYWKDSESLWTRALACTSSNAIAHYNLGNDLLKRGKLDDAIVQYQETLEIRPGLSPAHYNLGNAFLKHGQLDEAIVCYRQTLKINPRSDDACANLGLAFLRKGETKEAIDCWGQALAINPGQITVQNNLAWLLATTSDTALRNGTRAIALATQANQLSEGGNPVILHTLAAAYAEEGGYGLAMSTARRALELALAQKQDALAATLRKEIKLYESNTPLRNAPP